MTEDVRPDPAAFIPLVHHVINKMFKPRDMVVADEMAANGYLALVRASHKWRPEMRTTFKTYAWWYIVYAIRNYQKKECLYRQPLITERQWKMGRSRPVTPWMSLFSELHSGFVHGSADVLARDDPAVANTNVRLDLAVMLAHLPNIERKVLDLRFGLTSGVPLTLEKIATKIGVSKQMIQYRERRAFRRLQDRYLPRRGRRGEPR